MDVNRGGHFNGLTGVHHAAKEPGKLWPFGGLLTWDQGSKGSVTLGGGRQQAVNQHHSPLVQAEYFTFAEAGQGRAPGVTVRKVVRVSPALCTSERHGKQAHPGRRHRAADTPRPMQNDNITSDTCSLPYYTPLRRENEDHLLRASEMKRGF